jgi:acyl-homoserine lactone synthase
MLMAGRADMIHVISATNRHLYQDAIENHFRIRHEIFVRERGWKALDRPDGREVDAYDNDDSIYLLAMEGNRVLGGHRLYPTLKSTMIEDVFPHLATVRGIPSAAHIWEWARLFVIKERRDRRVYLELLASLQEFCLEEGITQVSGVLETWWVPGFQQVGMAIHPLGLPVEYDGAITMAALFDVSVETLAEIRSQANIDGSVLVRNGPQQRIVERALTQSLAARGS